MPACCRAINDNPDITGFLPDLWSTGYGFQSLQGLFLSNNNLIGTLPASWSLSAGWRKLQQLDISRNNLTGALGRVLHSLASHHRFLSPLAFTCAPAQPRGLRRTAGILPPCWGNHTAFPRLWQLNLSQNSISGPLPDVAWGQPATWPNLAQLDVSRELPLLPNNPSTLSMSCDLTAASGDAQCSVL